MVSGSFGISDDGQASPAAVRVNTRWERVEEPASIAGGDPLLQWLPFTVMGAVALVSVLGGPAFRALPLLALGPAFAGLRFGVRRTALVGVLAITLCVMLAAFAHVLGHRHDNLTLASIGGVTVASALASARRQQRERELATARTVAEVAQRVLLRPVPRTAGPLTIAVSYTSATHEARIGGDLYEVIASPFGVRILIGDVQGKGLDAVETAAAVLGAFREAAYDEADPLPRHRLGIGTRSSEPRLHPTILTTAGIRPALKALARRSQSPSTSTYPPVDDGPNGSRQPSTTLSRKP